MSRLRRKPGADLARISGRTLAMVLLLALAAACGRPMTRGESRFASDIFGDTLKTDSVRVVAGFGLVPAPTPQPLPPSSGKLWPLPGVCERVPQGPRTEPPPAFVLYNSAHLRRDLYRPDTAPGWPNRVMLPQALIMAHELTHIWQWQNRKLTGYRPVHAVLESLFNLDPYYYQPGDRDGLLSFGYEQQAALVEDYLCYGLFEPDHPRRAELRTLLSPHFPLDRLDAALKH